ncbi:MAG: hypothetical protein HFI30_05060 [Lachnospiraceae bacterium]|jgi:hypothetical protein|nr:hypothetical protein [Lachnospiraceae bacterium]
MKRKWGYLGLTVLMGALLAGCQEMPEEGSRLRRYTYEDIYGGNEWEDDYSQDDWDQELEDLIDQYFSGNQGYGDDTYYHEGAMGETMENVFFTFRVDDAWFVDSYGGYEPREGCELVDVLLTIENTFGEEIPMFNTDFQIQWGGEGDDDYEFALSDLAQENPEIMPDEFMLEDGEERQYHLIYEVPAGNMIFSVSYLEVFADDSEGNVYFVYFMPVDKTL